MTVLQIGVPFETSDAVILVEIDPENPLTVGRHRFQLQVVDDAGNASNTAELIVQVIDASNPNAVIDGPSQIEFMRTFELSGRKSFDVGGTITKYIWTLLD